MPQGVLVHATLVCQDGRINKGLQQDKFSTRAAGQHNPPAHSQQQAAGQHNGQQPKKTRGLLRTQQATEVFSAGTTAYAVLDRQCMPCTTQTKQSALLDSRVSPAEHQSSLC
jgi:hypothetical protein